jgi:hypothetical protein
MNATLATVVVAVGFMAMGLVALLRPAQIMAYFGVAQLTADSRNEIRAVYGGFGVALGGLLALSAGSAVAEGVQLAAAVSLLGMAAGRVVAWCGERSGCWPWIFGGIEIAGGRGALLRPLVEII